MGYCEHPYCTHRDVFLFLALEKPSAEGPECKCKYTITQYESVDINVLLFINIINTMCPDVSSTYLSLTDDGWSIFTTHTGSKGDTLFYLWMDAEEKTTLC